MSREDYNEINDKNVRYIKLFGENIKFLRTNLTQKSLRIFAYENDISCATLSRIESGQRIPNLLTLKKIANGLNLALADLINKIEENIPDSIKIIDD